LVTKFTYKMRSGGKRAVGVGDPSCTKQIILSI
jgi:hypothetical protein